MRSMCKATAAEDSCLLVSTDFLMFHVQAYQGRRERWAMQRFAELSAAVLQLQQQAERTQQVEIELSRTKAKLVSLHFFLFH